MPEQFEETPSTVGIESADSGRNTRRKGKRSSRPVASNHRETLAQVTIHVPRDVLAVFDQFADSSGVVRSQLIREALDTYAALLSAGQRTFHQPGMQARRVA
jgi:hypothetical protein